MSGQGSPPKPAENRAPTLENLAPLLVELRSHTGELESSGASTEAQLARMARAGVTRWGIPPEYGGCELSAADQTEGFEKLAAACLVSTFVLTQRAAAVSRIVGSSNESLKTDLLPRLARHELLATVGISHLTTSRQHLGRPAVTATPDGNAFILDGSIPWVTAGAICDQILTGGTLPDGRQLLALVQTDDPGITIDPPPELLALNASQTGPVSLTNVRVARVHIVAGPVEGVMKGAAGSTGSVTTSALAVGAAAGVLDQLQIEADRRPELQEILRPLMADRESISADIRTLLESPADLVPTGLTSESIRQRANSLALRASQAFLGASKGAGFVKGHPAERAVREAMFFLVWSCPQPVVHAALRRFACLAE